MASDKKNSSAFQLWFEEAWEGWIRPIGLIVVLAILYALYKLDLVGETGMGALLVLAVVLGALGAGIVPAFPLTRAPWQRALLATLSLAALAATAYPTLRVVFPGQPLAEVTLTTAQSTATVTPSAIGPFDVTVSGHFKDTSRAEAEASYTLKVSDNSGGSDEVDGAVRRKQMTIRSRRGSSSSLLEQNEQTQRLPHVRGPQVTLATDVDEQLDGGLHLELRRGSVNPVVFLVLGILALLMALVLDVKLVDWKSNKKSYLVASVGLAFAFAVAFPDEATPHALVRPAVSSFLLALVLGGLGGM
ncbi:MAG TPA: hypothetical protein VIA18_10965, partial [Polyangia bacterium]|nr:hypothetical protein [Polyangia bacterium]